MKIRSLCTMLLVFNSTIFTAWKMVWNDEFDYTGLPDSTKWGYDVGTGSNGWGNNELEYYTKDSLKNAHVENGKLFITAVKEKIETSNYSSVRLVSREKGDWLYGRFEVAAKVPKGVGLWPAIWMLPTDWKYGNWPSSGEIDIMENVGFDSMNVHFNIHTEAYNHSIGTNKGATVHLGDPHTTFNVYALEWYEDSLLFFVNNQQVFMFKNEHTDYKTWPYDKRFHLLLNVAVGGSWGGQQGVNDAAFPASMVIDYVRVYEYTDAAATVPDLRRQNGTSFFTMNENRIMIPAATAGKLSLYDERKTSLCRSGIAGAVRRYVAVPFVAGGIPCGTDNVVVHRFPNTFHLQIRRIGTWLL